MKNESLEKSMRGWEEVIAMFGDAKFVRSDGRLELRGGSMADRAEAMEWLMIMMPDEVARLRR